MTDLLGLGMKTQQELMQAYWGPGGTVDMVKEYNAKHGCDVQPWECVRSDWANTFTQHPTFGNPGSYYIALTILYDDKLKKHRPVWGGSELYYLGDKVIVKDICNGVLTFECGGVVSLSSMKISWNPPTPKRTFKLEFTEEEMKALMCLTSMSQSHVLVDLHNKFTAATARGKE